MFRAKDATMSANVPDRLRMGERRCVDNADRTGVDEIAGQRRDPTFGAADVQAGCKECDVYHRPTILAEKTG